MMVHPRGVTRKGKVDREEEVFVRTGAIVDHDLTTSMMPSWRITVLVLSCTIVLLIAAYWSTAQSMAKQ
jgi:hypothetical protein